MAASSSTKDIDTELKHGKNKYDEFFSKTRLIMLKTEKKIYKNLPDVKSKKAFIKDFWAKRDPNPETEANEGRIEFERRAATADHWFRESVGSGRGWDTDRGRMYLLMGPPDNRSIGQNAIYDRTGLRKRVNTELWVYDNYQVSLLFADEDGFGVYRLRNYSPRILTAIEEAKLGTHYLGKPKQSFKFKAKYKNDAINIAIPSKHVSFDEKDGVMEARFRVRVYVYQDHKRVDSIDKEVNYLHHDMNELLKRKNINITVPYSPPAKGKYIFDIILDDTMSSSRYRDMIKQKI
jgi:GWxTD domain-containing protein